MKISRKMLSIIGLILLLGGTIITAIVTISYRSEADQTRNKIKTLSEDNKVLNENIESISNENKELNHQIRNLSERISEQSKVIENQITGGDAHGIIQFFYVEGRKIYHPVIFNKSEKYPLLSVSVYIRDIDKRENCPKYTDPRNGKVYIDQQCDNQALYRISLKNLPPGQRYTAENIAIPINQLSTRYFATINSRNSVVYERIEIKKEGINRYFGYEVEREGKKEEPIFHGEYHKRFKWDFDFESVEYSAMDSATIKKLNEETKK